jgi:hypothetical protein
MLNVERYKIKGKTYRKIGEETVNPADRCIVDEIWILQNHQGQEFRLMVRRGRSNSFRLYEKDGKFVCGTYSISQVK